VDSNFQEAAEQSKCLFDFVDEAGVQELYETIKQGIDRFSSAQRSFTDSRASFNDLLQEANNALDVEHEHMSKSQGFEMDGVSPIPHFFEQLENHANEVASHLQGLVKHYDLCVSALRNTEGGGEMISKMSQDETEGQESKLAGFGLGITKLDDDEPIPSEEDRVAMLHVIVKDAHQVEEVVEEIKERLLDMEDLLSRIQSYMTSLRLISEGLKTAHQTLKQLMNQIPEYVSACAIFQQTWEDEKAVLVTRVDEMAGLNEFYQGFAQGYDNLIVEVQRRRKAKREMEKLVSSTLDKLDKLYKGM
jgi:autophagy-related protein 17